MQTRKNSDQTEISQETLPWARLRLLICPVTLVAVHRQIQTHFGECCYGKCCYGGVMINVAMVTIDMVTVAVVTVAMVSGAVLAHTHPCMYPPMHVPTHACTHPPMHVPTHVCTHPCMYTPTHACTHPCMYTPTHACTHPCMYPPMHAHNMLTVNIPQQKFAELQSCSVASYTNKATMKNSSTHHTHHTHRGTDGFTYLSFQHSTNGETVPEKRAYRE